MKVYGVSVSYYTGKLETYLRYKGIAYDMEPPYAKAKEILPHTGAIQVPMVHRDDGRWMSDSTPIIAHLETEYSDNPIMPEDPVVRFIALLIEDYADEWLWRAAMHYRWSYEHDRALLSRIIVDEAVTHLRLPRFLRLRTIARRQHTSFVLKDGVTVQTRDHVEQGYLNALANMSKMLEQHPFLLGTKPSIADFGLMGPMLRHFGQDPTPQEIMRNRGPKVYAWVARMWNAAGTGGELVEAVPDACADMLKEIAQTHLVQLACNARAYAGGKKKFDMSVQGCQYVDLPVSRYRVYCLERLREEFAGLGAQAQERVKGWLGFPEAEVIWTNEPVAQSDYDVQRQAPFNKAINVYGTGTPE